METGLNENILNTRANGILLPIFSLPSKYGIGTLGQAAKDFIDFLEQSGQKYWQILPSNPTTLENSPYTAFSSMAGNELFIDLDALIEQGFLEKQDVADQDFGTKPAYIDYGKVRKSREALFAKAYQNFKKKLQQGNVCSDYYEFCQLNHFWLDDYALFMTIKKHFNMAKLKTWPDEFKLCDKEAIYEFAQKHEDAIEVYKVLQYFFAKQWDEMRQYANERSVYIVGDMPFYVAHDSVDVWAHPEVFQLDKNLNKTEVAGCPPDAFSTDGQLWGNPIYNWKYLKRNKYSWWDKRLQQLFRFYDVLRIDHFRGFESYYTIHPDAETAKMGYWEKGPDQDFFRQLNDTLEGKSIIAEDLGFITSDVKQLLVACEYPGMKVLQFAFDSQEPTSRIYLPYKYPRNSVVYVGTHDNNTACGWYDEADKADLQIAQTYLNAQTKEEVLRALIRAAMGSVANTCILCVQDLLMLGSEARINVPGQKKGNWMWRLTEETFGRLNVEQLRKITALFGRC